jgi:hypothetical protein
MLLNDVLFTLLSEEYLETPKWITGRPHAFFPTLNVWKLFYLHLMNSVTYPCQHGDSVSLGTKILTYNLVIIFLCLLSSRVNFED